MDGHTNAIASSSRHTLLDPPPAPRVSQVDADELDEGLVGMLGERVERSLGLFRESWGSDLKPEISLVLKLVLFGYSFFSRNQASPGARLQNLKLVGRGGQRIPRKLLILYLLLHPPILPSYILTRLRKFALSRQWPDLPSHDLRRKVWKAIVRVENFARAWELAGWGLFLWDGRYPSLLMRMLGIRLVPASPHLTRLVSYEFMNRQLVWGAFTEFLFYSIPILPTLPSSISPTSWIQQLKSAFVPPPSVDYNSLPLLPSRPMANGNRAHKAAHSGQYAHLPLSTCPICYSRTHNAPVEMGAHISLPALARMVSHTPSAGVEGGSDEEAETDDESRLYVPAQADCWGGCRYCYYCIAQELAKWREEEEAREKAGTLKTSKPEVAERRGLECLRCGGLVRNARRSETDSLNSMGPLSDQSSV